MFFNFSVLRSLILFSTITMLSGSVFTACVQPTYQSSSLGAVNSSDSATSVVVFSISSTKPAFSHYNLEIVNMETKRKENLHIATGVNPDIKSDSLDVYYASMVLPRGEYRIYSWRMAGDRVSNNVYLSAGGFSIPFTVVGGHVNYLGDFLAQNKVSKTMGWKYPTTGIFILSDRFITDFSLIHAKFPNYDLTNVMDAMPDLVGSNSKYSGIYQKGIHTP